MNFAVWFAPKAARYRLLYSSRKAFGLGLLASMYQSVPNISRSASSGQVPAIFLSTPKCTCIRAASSTCWQPTSANSQPYVAIPPAIFQVQS